MKIGIVTYWTTRENYGQILQMYALSSYLKTLGHKVFIIRYNGYRDETFQRSIYKRLFNFIKKPQKIVNYIKGKIKERIVKQDLNAHDCGFDDFRKQYFEWSNLYDNYSALKSNPPEADFFICGSDMIWVESNKCAPYFLDFVKKGKKIAYAPSFGSKEVSNIYMKKISKYLQNFSLITVREKSGVEICKQMGYHAYWVVDPTALLSANDYCGLEQPIVVDKKFIFMYLLGHDTYIPFGNIKKFAEDNSFSLIYRACGRRDKFPKSYLTINQWLYAIHHSEFVVTNSFHGCMFCILYHKKFLYLPLVSSSKMNNERIFSLLGRLNLTDRIYNGDFNRINEEIDYDNVDKLLSLWRQQSQQILISSLK